MTWFMVCRLNHGPGQLQNKLRAFLIESWDSKAPEAMRLQFLCPNHYCRGFQGDANDSKQCRFRIQLLAAARMNYPNRHNGVLGHFLAQSELAARIAHVARFRALGEKV